MSPDRKADRHDPAGPKGIFTRLERDDDTWFRQHVKTAGMTVSQGLKAAVRAYRKQAEAAAETTETTTEGDPR